MSSKEVADFVKCNRTRRVDPVALVFYKESLGVGEGLTVLCDVSFIKWYFLNEGNSPSRSLGKLLEVEHYSLVTTGCVQEAMDLWYKLDGDHKSPKVAGRVEVMRNMSCFCGHIAEYINPKECIEEEFKEQHTREYFFASVDKVLIAKIKKHGTPVITVSKGKLILLQPTRAEKRLLEVAKETRIQ
ncbi:uncharacterized protein LOC110888537 [Helianthus annuus]|uniref:uncharacterized protein LOC110888537 n=1 Tax=Helianthus annuus TaxID=4232 RepID=UPI0016531E0D|nr:uncharacterized protein LOC110888537 [Helianthus annuus]